MLAQQYFLINRHADARAAIDRVIELATAPGQPLSAAALARYYYYKGRILDAAGDARSAAPQYRRAIEYDPGYAPPALVLGAPVKSSGGRSRLGCAVGGGSTGLARRGAPSPVRCANDDGLRQRLARQRALIRPGHEGDCCGRSHHQHACAP